MSISRIVIASLFLLLAAPRLPAAAAAQAIAPASDQVLRVPRMVVPEARLPIRLKKVDVRAEIVGSAAHTRIEMVFYNPNEDMLEGELQFPLLDGQTVTRSSVDRDQAQPEETQGNNFNLHVPLPAKGTYNVMLKFDEKLSDRSTDGINKGVPNVTYRLPLQFGESVEQLEVAVHNPGIPAWPSAMAVRAQLGGERIKVNYRPDEGSRSGSLVQFSRKNYAGTGMLTVNYPYHDMEKSADPDKAIAGPRGPEAMEHACVYQDLTIKITTEQERDIQIALYKGSNKVAACSMRVTSYYDGKKGASLEALTRFEKITCEPIDGMDAYESLVIDQGYLKMFPNSKTSSVYVIKNVQPLRCNVTMLGKTDAVTQ